MCFVHHPICTHAPSNILEPRYLGYLPPSAVVGVSGEARGVVGAAGAGGGAGGLLPVPAPDLHDSAPSPPPSDWLHSATVVENGVL